MAGQSPTGQNRTSNPRVQSQAARSVGSGTGGGRSPKPAPPRKRSRLPLVITSAAVLGGLALAWGAISHSVDKISGGQSNTKFWATVTNPRGQFPGKNRVNILLIGKDYSYLWHTNNMKLRGARYSTQSRSDSIMILSLDMDSKKISALSIPRDTWVDAPDGNTGKINATYSRGGHEMLEGTIANLLGVKPDYYVALTPEVVQKLVDKLGGVEVETIDAMRYDDSTAGLHINLPKGKQFINGAQAVGYARYREVDPFVRDEKGNPIYLGHKDASGNPVFRMKTKAEIAREHSDEASDMRRMIRQRQLIAAMKSKAVSPQNLFQIPDFIDTGLGLLETNLDRSQIIALAALFRDTPPDKIENGTLATHATFRKTLYGRTYALEVDERKKQPMVDWLLKGDESAADRLTVVSVENGTAIPGAAKRVADLLKAQGFTASAQNSAQRNVPATRIVYGKAMFAPRAQKIAQILGGGQLVKDAKPEAPRMHTDDSDEADVTIVLGSDLAGQFGQRSASL